MPVQPRPSDTFTRDNLLLGFSVVEFTPTSTGVPVPLGILSGETLQKEIDTLALERGDAGTLTVDREIISRFAASMSFELFNFSADIAQFIFGSSDANTTAISANPALAVANESFTLPNLGADSERAFVNLAGSDIDETSFIGSSITCDTITDEAVGTGDGTTGAVDGDFSLDYKPLIVADVTSVTVAGVTYTAVGTGLAASGNEVEVQIGTGSTSGNLQFHQGGVAVNVTGAIVATYTPSHAFANLTDYVVDPYLGKIRMLNIDGATDALRSGQPMLADYTYNQKSGQSMKPFTATSFEGSMTIRHLPDIGVNFVWEIPSATIRLTDDDLTFGADDFATATMQANINDAGGSNRFGTLTISSESQSV